jgi:PAS domain S-box-containing protein
MVKDPIKSPKNKSGVGNDADLSPALHGLPWLEILREGRIGRSSPAFHKLIGFQERELAEIPFSALFSEEDRREELPDSHSILAVSQEDFATSCPLKRKNGRMINVSLTYKRLPSADDSPPQNIPFSHPMLVVALELSSSQRPADGLLRLGKQLQAPLSLMALSLNLLREHGADMDASERADEIHQMQECLESCRRILSSACGQKNILAKTL